MNNTQVPIINGNSVRLNYDSLSQVERTTVDNIVAKFDPQKVSDVIPYGVNLQSDLEGMSDKLLQSVNVKDSGEMGQVLLKLVSQIQSMQPCEKRSVANLLSFGLLDKSKAEIVELKTKYQSVSETIEDIKQTLLKHKETLFIDIDFYEGLFNKTNEYFKYLGLSIIALQKKKDDIQSKIDGLNKQSDENSPEIFKMNALVELLNSVDKKIFDLELSRQLALQMGMQIQEMKTNDIALCDKLQSSIVITIPAWKTQAAIAIGIKNTQDALACQKAVTDITNTMLYQNAQMLKNNSLGIAQESQRGIIDPETLIATNNMLIETISEVLRIHKDGQSKQEAARKLMYEAETKLINVISASGGRKSIENSTLGGEGYLPI